MLLVEFQQRNRTSSHPSILYKLTPLTLLPCKLILIDKRERAPYPMERLLMFQSAAPRPSHTNPLSKPMARSIQTNFFIVKTYHEHC